MGNIDTIIIAEAGVNHNGSISRAKKLIDVADDAGADLVKFQTFTAETLVTKTAEKAKYQKDLTASSETQFEMIKKLELNRDNHEELIDYTKKKNIQFLSTAFDLESIDLLDDLDIPFYKIPSGEITNLLYLRHVGLKGKPIVISTGMANLSEVRDAMDVLHEVGVKKDDITIMHCTTEYPTPFPEVNLHAMLTIKNEFGVDVGYSDHTLGTEISVAAVALGAKIIEKHFTLDRNLPGPDHAASLEPNDLMYMVSSIRNIEKAMGNGIKKPSSSEMENISVVRKSIVAKKSIKKGEKFSENNLTVKRPGTGISPMLWDKVLGNIAKINYQKDDLIK